MEALLIPYPSLVHALEVPKEPLKPVRAALEGVVDLGTPVVGAGVTVEDRGHLGHPADVVVAVEALMIPPTQMEPLQLHGTSSGTPPC